MIAAVSYKHPCKGSNSLTRNHYSGRPDSEIVCAVPFFFILTDRSDFHFYSGVGFGVGVVASVIFFRRSY